jgi:dienelactone hydrolase
MGSSASAGSSLVRGDAPTIDSATGAGPFQVTTLTMGLRDGADYGTQTLHVPQGADGPLAAVAIVPGFNAAESTIAAWGPFLASHGIVALTIGTNSPTDSPDARASALLDALQTIQAENTRDGSPLQGKLATDHLGIMGWSMGGGGALIAASKTPSLRAAITMAAWSPGAQFASDQVPTLFFAGSADVNAGGQSQGFFTSLPSTTPKLLFEVSGGPHEIANDPKNADGAIGLYGLSWLEVFLVGDERYRPFLEQTPPQASDFRQNLTGAP